MFLLKRKNQKKLFLKELALILSLDNLLLLLDLVEQEKLRY
jgi:hypothetical protein